MLWGGPEGAAVAGPRKVGAGTAKAKGIRNRGGEVRDAPCYCFAEAASRRFSSSTASSQKRIEQPVVRVRV